MVVHVKMEYTCSKCLAKVRGGVKHLFSHLKFIHGLNSGSKQKIKCIQDGCTEVFSYCSSYKRHILAKHAHKVKQPTSRQQCGPKADAAQETVYNTESDDEENEELTDDDSYIDIDTQVEKFVAKMMWPAKV